MKNENNKNFTSTKKTYKATNKNTIKKIEIQTGGRMEDRNS